jgi:hypothetical protein
MSTTDLWTCRDGTPIAPIDLSGCKVEARQLDRLDRRGVERARGATSALPRVSEPIRKMPARGRPA